MTTIPDSLRSLFTARIREQDGRYTIEIPTNEIEHGTFQPGDVYRVAVLDAPDAATESGVSQTPTEPGTAERQPPEPPVEEGELRTVTVEAVGDQGDGIAKVDRGYVVIVPEATPGEQPRVRIEDVQQNVAFASIVDSDPRTL